ncbi:hypothetical protein [Marinilactibacillus sp. Marseille-P9653]|uniref:hypothetical protein n=1 Tax=Marinilactibacillus sp. Marseille-P9653 TaxID=2866583 RepID=UPI001CE4B4DA|nr:hypothetical protein [Marinilactibacillus sp. Marseille-P9653]
MILSNQTYMQLAFVACLILALLTLPLREIVTIGFFDISDLFVSLMIAVFIGYMINESMPGNAFISIGLFILILVTVVTGIVLLNIFVIIPFRSRSENSSATSIRQLEGKEGTVSVSITADGVGEVLVYTGFTKINRMAKIYENSSKSVTFIEQGTNVLVMDIKDSILYVLPYTNAIQATNEQQPTWNSNTKNRKRK